mgnify:CR=1 FL=1
MKSLRENNSDLETFANRLGLTGLDFDLFYETYYSMDTVEGDDDIEIQEALAELDY